MSGLKDVLLGSEGTPATIEDVRGPALRQLGQQAAGELGQILQGQDLGGIQGPFAAPMTGREGRLLEGIQRVATGANPEIRAAQAQLTQQATPGGALSPLVTQAGPQAVDLSQRILSGERIQPGTDPVLQRSIEAAQRPIMEQFGQQMGDLRGQFTQAGQFVQPGASSPFETAQARLQTGLAGALGDVSSDIVSQNLQAERQRQQQLIGQLGSAFESGQGRALQAAGQAVPFNRQQLQGLRSALEAQALPRQIRQLGLERGQQEFARQQGQFMRALQTAFGAAQPQTVQMPGQEGSGGLLGPVAQAAGFALGGPIGSQLGGMAASGIESAFS